MYNIKRKVWHFKNSKTYAKQQKSFNSDNNMTNLGDYNWLRKTPV